MHRNAAPSVLSVEHTYTRSVFEAILAGLGDSAPYDGLFVCDDAGAWIKHRDAGGELIWHPLCEILAPGSLNPLDNPWLPFPFTARQLAAVMTDGWGYFIQQRYGDWDSGPDEDELSNLDKLGGKAKEVLVAAYQAFRDAVELAPKLDRSLASTSASISEQYSSAREVAITHEGLREQGITPDEYRLRLARVNDTVADRGRMQSQAKLAADDAESAWRKAVVQLLLLPIERVPIEAFRSEVLKAIQPDRRAEALHQIKLNREYNDSEDGRAHWDLMVQQSHVENELRRWQLMRPDGVTEAVLHDTKLKELASELVAIADSLRALEMASSIGQKALTGTQNERKNVPLDYARLASRDELVAAFGSFGLKREWFDDLGSRRWLLDARKVRGQSQRGRRREPLFCPLAVMTGLIQSSRKSWLTASTGWRILEQRFPVVYAANSVGDPR